MRNSKQYYEDNYSGLETSEEVIDALDDISAEIGADFNTLWADGCTEQISPKQMFERVVNKIIENEGSDVRGLTFYWGDSFDIPFEIDDLHIYDSQETVSIGRDEEFVEWLKQFYDNDDEIQEALDKDRVVSIIDMINGVGNSYKYTTGDIYERVEWIRDNLEFNMRTTMFVVEEYLRKYCPEYEFGEDEEKIHLNNIVLPTRIRNYVIDTDIYTTDDGGYIYDPYEGEYPNIDQIYEQYEYDVGGDD